MSTLTMDMPGNAEIARIKLVFSLADNMIVKSCTSLPSHSIHYNSPS